MTTQGREYSCLYTEKGLVAVINSYGATATSNLIIKNPKAFKPISDAQEAWDAVAGVEVWDAVK